ncbi:hypothetical protein Acr_11g0017110 [Actinidia rufa]|uniref:Late embryogenesis abundant (LEA) hydroxyproline-rich glycoprotein family n=1 Tax=Actinidia rufa TaxID=165716 RepID=A0A7J0FFG1_9ERIC|nr:hypothetical protein Acr_11g0017110 [Actinidia rufa]
MSEQAKQVLQKPLGYRDPSAEAHAPTSWPPLPPKQVLPPSFRRRNKRRRSYCCYTFLVIFIPILVVALAGCFFYLCRFNITTDSDGPALTSETVVRVEVKTPNHAMKINYANIAQVHREGEESAGQKRGRAEAHGRDSEPGGWDQGPDRDWGGRRRLEHHEAIIG